MGEEHLLELVDWCYRKLSWLNSPAGQGAKEAKERSAKQLLAQGPEEEQAERVAELDFSVALCAGAPCPALPIALLTWDAMM